MYNKQYRKQKNSKGTVKGDKKGFNMKNKRMKIARIEKDVSQEQLATLVGVTRQTISMIEAGKFNPSLQLCIGICKALGKTLDELFWEEENENI